MCPSLSGHYSAEDTKDKYMKLNQKIIGFSMFGQTDIANQITTKRRLGFVSCNRSGQAKLRKCSIEI